MSVGEMLDCSTPPELGVDDETVGWETPVLSFQQVPIPLADGLVNTTRARELINPNTKRPHSSRLVNVLVHCVWSAS